MARKAHNTIELHGIEATVGSISYLLWCVGCVLMRLPEFHWRIPIAWTVMITGLVLLFVAPVVG